MALFTDGSIANLNDLRAYETSILDLAGAEAIDLGAKLSVAMRELQLQIVAFLLRRGCLTDNQRDLHHVVVTEPLLHAHTMLTLSLVYRDAFNSQLNDRYEGKWKQYSELASQASRQLLDIGIGISAWPIPKPQPPAVELLLGGLSTAGSYSVRCALVGPSGLTGAPSDVTTWQTTPGQNIEVTLGDVPAGLTGWILYVADGDGPLLRQTPEPLGSHEVWSCPAEGLRTDLPAVLVQVPDYYVANRRELLRG